MIRGFERFVTAVRREGIAVSPAEWIDAMRALERVGLDRRATVHAALRATLVKHSTQLARFDEVFARFFASPRPVGEGRRRRRRGSGVGDRGESTRSRPRGHGEGLRHGRPAKPAEDAKSPHLAKSSDHAGKSHAAKPPEPSKPFDLGELISRVRTGSPERRDRLRHVVLEPTPAREEALRGSPERDPLRRDLRRRWTLEQERELASALPRLVERIRLRSGRRLRHDAHGRPDLRRLFRANLGQGGAPFVIPRRRSRPRRNRVVLLLDVSWSTARACGLFLSIAGAFLSRVGRVRVLAFVDRAVEASAPLGAWSAATAGRRGSGGGARRPGGGLVRGGQSFADTLQRVAGLNLEAPSDYGRTFHGLLGSALRPAGRDTVLLVLGDGRTNRFEPLAWAFEELTQRCGAVLWLVPEPRASWGRGDSALAEYLPHADVAVEARDAVGLARGVGELLRRI